MGYSYVNIGRDNMYMDSGICTYPTIYDCWVCPKKEGGRVGEFSLYSRWNNFVKSNKYRGWYLGRTVGSRFCSCNVALPPNHYIFHAQAKKQSLQKCNPSLDEGLLQKPKNLTRGPSRDP